MNKGILFGGLAIVGYYLLNSTAALKKLDYEVQGVRIKNFDIKHPSELTLTVLVRFNNPGNTEYTANSVRLNVYHEGSILGDVFTDAPTVVRPASFSLVEFPLRLRVLTVANKLLPLLLANKPLPAVDVSGFVNLAGVDTDINQTVPLAPFDPRNLTPATPAGSKPTTTTGKGAAIPPASTTTKKPTTPATSKAPAKSAKVPTKTVPKAAPRPAPKKPATKKPAAKPAPKRPAPHGSARHS